MSILKPGLLCLCLLDREKHSCLIRNVSYGYLFSKNNTHVEFLSFLFCSNLYMYIYVFLDSGGNLYFWTFWLQIPSVQMLQYTTQVLGVILALLDDSDESVQLTAVTCLLTVNPPALYRHLCNLLLWTNSSVYFLVIVAHFLNALDAWVITQWCGGSHFA